MRIRLYTLISSLLLSSVLLVPSTIAKDAWIETEPNSNQRSFYLQRPDQNHQPPIQRMKMNDLDEEHQESAKKESIVRKAVSMPMSVAGATAGVTIGVPVKVCKSIFHHTKTMDKSMRDGVGVEDKEIDLAGKGMAAFCSYPFGFMSGMIHGTIKGVERGIQTGSKKPFSKESFSLTDPKQQQASK